MIQRWKNLSLNDIVEEIDGVIYAEQWKDIPYFEGMYMVSTFGRIKSLARTRKSHRGTIAAVTEKIMSQKVQGNGYLSLGLRKLGSKRKFYSAHKLVAIVFHGGDKIPLTVNHLDGIKKNNFYLNIEWSTQKENNDHAISIGLVNNVGSANSKAKVSESDVVEIRRLSKSGVGYNELASMMNVGKNQISRIISKKAWKHVV